MNVETQLFGSSSVSSVAPFSCTYARHPSANEGEFDVSPAVSQSLSSSIPCSSAQLYPASCPLQSDVHGDPAKVEEGRSAAEVSSDSVEEESEFEGVDVTAGVLPTSVLEWVSSKTNPTAMMITQMTFLPKRVTSLRNIIDRVSIERNCGN